MGFLTAFEKPSWKVTKTFTFSFTLTGLLSVAGRKSRALRHQPYVQQLHEDLGSPYCFVGLLQPRARLIGPGWLLIAAISSPCEVPGQAPVGRRTSWATLDRLI
jgi:hypothetical protein